MATIFFLLRLGVCNFLLLRSGPFKAAATNLLLVNHCNQVVWPAIQPNGGKPILANGGFELDAGQSTTLEAADNWGGRIWGRTGCQFDSSGSGSCTTGDCGGVLECKGAGGDAPVTLFEITMDGYKQQDFYDVSLVDGYNLEISVSSLDGTGSNCTTIGCTSDLNAICPPDLQVNRNGQVIACKSACDAFNQPQYCCTGPFGSADTCKPTSYSEVFKRACPKAYSYAYDDASSTFTCTGSTQYTITFCPS